MRLVVYDFGQCRVAGDEFLGRPHISRNASVPDAGAEVRIHQQDAIVNRIEHHTDFVQQGTIGLVGGFRRNAGLFYGSLGLFALFDLFLKLLVGLIQLSSALADLVFQTASLGAHTGQAPAHSQGKYANQADCHDKLEPPHLPERRGYLLRNGSPRLIPDAIVVGGFDPEGIFPAGQIGIASIATDSGLYPVSIETL